MFRSVFGFGVVFFPLFFTVQSNLNKRPKPIRSRAIAPERGRKKTISECVFNHHSRKKYFSSFFNLFNILFPFIQAYHRPRAFPHRQQQIPIDPILRQCFGLQLERGAARYRITNLSERRPLPLLFHCWRARFRNSKRHLKRAGTPRHVEGKLSSSIKASPPKSGSAFRVLGIPWNWKSH